MALPSQGSEFAAVRARLAALRADPAVEEARSAEIDTALERIRQTLEGVRVKADNNHSTFEEIRTQTVTITQSAVAQSPTASPPDGDISWSGGSSGDDRSAAGASP